MEYLYFSESNRRSAKVILKDLFIIIIYLFVFLGGGYWSFCECRSEESNSRGGGGVKKWEWGDDRGIEKPRGIIWK